MKVGIFGDVHITKNMRTLQNIWEDSAKKSIVEMYKVFSEEEVDLVICLGDFFDTPKIEAKHLHLLLPILNYMNSFSYPTYLLLGNHEIDDNEHNILEYLSEYKNIKPVIDYDIIQGQLTLIPYNVNPEELDRYYIHNQYVFTHHDIYGSELAGGKTKAFFGLDTSVFKEAKGVFNGHVHLKSKISPNIINAGSLLVSQQGELRVGDYPSYYILNTESGSVIDYDNIHSMIYLAIQQDEVEKIIQKKYDKSKLVLRIDYEGEIPNYTLDTAHTSWRKKIESIESDTQEIASRSNFDLKNYLAEYIKKDSKVADKDKEEYIRIGLEVLD